MANFKGTCLAVMEARKRCLRGHATRMAGAHTQKQAKNQTTQNQTKRASKQATNQATNKLDSQPTDQPTSHQLTEQQPNKAKQNTRTAAAQAAQARSAAQATQSKQNSCKQRSARGYFCSCAARSGHGASSVLLVFAEKFRAPVRK